MAQDVKIYVKNETEQRSATEPISKTPNSSPANKSVIRPKNRTKQTLALGGGLIVANKAFNFAVSEMGSYGYDITQQNVQEGLRYGGLIALTYASPVIGGFALATTVGKTIYDRYREIKKDTEKQKNVNMLNGGIATNDSLYSGGGLL